jgi:hypothetical protein
VDPLTKASGSGRRNPAICTAGPDAVSGARADSAADRPRAAAPRALDWLSALARRVAWLTGLGWALERVRGGTAPPQRLPRAAREWVDRWHTRARIAHAQRSRFSAFWVPSSRVAECLVRLPGDDRRLSEMKTGPVMSRHPRHHRPRYARRSVRSPAAASSKSDVGVFPLPRRAKPSFAKKLCSAGRIRTPVNLDDPD